LNFFEILLIAISMAMDAFAVCLGVGTTGQIKGTRPTFRLAFHFGFFQFMMPVAGWFAGTMLLRQISAYDHWVAFALLAFVGGRMIWAGFHPEENRQRNDPSRGWNLLILSIATSIDALAIGLSLGLVGVVIWYPAIVIGLVTGLISWLGLRLGNKFGETFGKKMEIIGGSVLIIIGIRVVLYHIFV
jgi:putative Mn2+ efflux pump MntP